MSLILAINTASKESAIALVEREAILGEASWLSEANESEKLLPGIQELMIRSGKAWIDLNEVWVVCGPGSYTSLRIGIAVANSIAWSLKLPMRAPDAFEVWKNRMPDMNKGLIAVQAGKNTFLTEKGGTFYSLEELQRFQKPIYGELPDEVPLKQKPVRTFGEAIASLVQDHKLSVHSFIEPLYTRPPEITVPRLSKMA